MLRKSEIHASLKKKGGAAAKILQPHASISRGEKTHQAPHIATKKITLGRLETSQDFRTKKKIEEPKISVIEGLKITVRTLTNEDVENRKLPVGTTGVVITKIENDSPINFLSVNDVIVEAQKKKIITISDLQNIVKTVLRSSEKTILIAIYNNQNQRRYIGVKLD